MTALENAPVGGSRLLYGKRVVITGGTRGIGAACATACASAGASEIALLSRSDEQGNRTVAELRSLGTDAWHRACDVTDVDELRAAFTYVDQVDVLVNSAGTNQPEPFLEVDPATFDRLWLVNVKATFFAAQAAARRMVENDAPGVIVNISSQMGHVGAIDRSAYCTTKHAVEGLTKALAVELAPRRIRVVSVAPTFVRTEMTANQLDDPQVGSKLLEQIPLGRFADPDEVAAAVVWSASDAASMLTGSSVVLDGGWTAR